MALNFGFDLGATSVGWAVTNDKEILGLGVHIFPVGVKDDSFAKSGKEESKAVNRRAKRMAARLKKRYHLRKKRLLELFEKAGLPPMKEVLNQIELFELRHRAANQKVELNELTRLLFWLNQRRGFKSGRKDLSKDDKEKGKMKEAMADLKAKVQKYKTQTAEKEVNTARKTVITLGSYFFHQYQLGSDFGINNQPKEPIRRRFVPRELYVEEFNAIWDEQAKHYPTLLNPDLKDEIGDKTIFFQRKLKPVGHLVSKCRFEPKKRAMPKSHPTFQDYRLWQKLNDLRFTDQGEGTELLPLTLDQRHTVYNKVKFEEKVTKKKVRDALGIKSTGFHWNFDNDLKGNITLARIRKAFVDYGPQGEEMFRDLSPNEIEAIWHKMYCMEETDLLTKNLMEKHQLPEEIALALANTGLEPDYAEVSHKAGVAILAYMRELGLGYAEACKHVGYHHSFVDRTREPLLEVEDLVLEKLLKRYNLSVNSPLVKRILAEMLRVTRELLKKYGRPDYIKLELARDIQGNAEDRERARSKNILKENQRDAYREFIKKHTDMRLIKQDDIRKFELFLELECVTTDLEELGKTVGGFDAKKFQNFIANTSSDQYFKYQQWLNCNRISIYTGKPITFQQLWNGEVEIEHIIPYSMCQDNSFANLSLCEKEINIEKRKQTPLQWLGNNQQKVKDFKARVMKLEKYLGKGKVKRLLCDIDNATEDELNSFRPDHLVATRQAGKAAVTMLYGVCNRNPDEKLPVRVMTGQLTAALREEWSLNGILNEAEIEALKAKKSETTDPKEKQEIDGQIAHLRTKDRTDHRHHAIDALVIAVASQNMVQKASTNARFAPRGQGKQSNRFRLGGIEPPMSLELFLKQAQVKLDEILVSYLKKDRIVSKRRNPYHYWNIHKNPNKPQQHAIAPRGALHAESMFGQIKHPVTGELVFVKKESVETLLTNPNKRDKVVDFAVKEVLNEAIKNKWQKGEPVYLPTKDGRKIPINKVRVAVNGAYLTVRPSDNKLAKPVFADNDKNYGVAIYEAESGEREEVILNLWDAIKRRMSGLPLFEPNIIRTVGKGKKTTEKEFKLKITLQRNDMVIRNEMGWKPEEINSIPFKELSKQLYRVQKLSKGDYNLRFHLASTTNFDEQLIRIRSAKDLNVVKVRISICGEVELI